MNTLPLFACAVRPSGNNEVDTEAKAHAAVKEAWTTFRAQKAWGESQPRGWVDVAREAREKRTDIHMGIPFGSAADKNSDLTNDDARRKFKGRVFSRGNHVKHQSWEAAMFQELGSSPVSTDAGRLIDANGVIQYHDVQQSDAVQAYFQAPIERV